MPKQAANPGTRRRILWWLAPCFAAAIVMSVLVAWGFASFGALLIPEESDYITYVDGRDALWTEFYCTGGRAFQLFPPTKDAARAQRQRADPSYIHADPPYFTEVPAPGDESAGTILHGWPVVCLFCEFNEPKTGRPTVHGEAQAKLADLRFTVPYKVHWLGMVADVAIYTALFAAVRLRPRSVIRWRRLRRGQCLSCGYDRRGLALDAVCPECGMP